MEFKRLMEINSKLKTVDIKGKPYVEVNQRVLAFRELYPNGAITTELLKFEDGLCVVMASAFNEEGKILSTGLAYEKESSSFINKTSFLENCESSAVGRCLSFIGLGINTSIASAEEVGNAIKQQNDVDREALMKELKKAIADNEQITEKILCDAVGITKIVELETHRLPGAITFVKEYKKK